jgi:hypothetical protein
MCAVLPRIRGHFFLLLAAWLCCRNCGPSWDLGQWPSANLRPPAASPTGALSPHVSPCQGMYVHRNASSRLWMRSGAQCCISIA